MKHWFSLSVLALTLILLTSVADAGQVTTQLTFSQPTITVVDGYHRVTMPEALNIDDPGTPSLPSVGIWLLLAPGDQTVSYELKRDVWEKLPGQYRIEPTPTPVRLSDPNPPPTAQPDPTIYGGQTAYPPEPISSLTTHLKRGYALATCLVWPVRWNPSDGSLEYLAEAELVVQTAPGEREIAGFNRFFRGDPSTHQWILDRVNNPEDIGPYPRRDEGDPEAMLIITDEEFLDQTEEYVQWRQTRGMQTYVMSVDQLVENGNGQDDQESIRDGIIDAYAEWDISYVLLLGDDEQIPHRGLFGTVGDGSDLDIPADLYYAGLDGWWNTDGDNRWGELNESDLLAEVYVGRIPADNSDEIARSLNKVYLYTDEPVIDDVMKVLMVGEDLGWDAWGGEYMDEVYEETNRWGYHTSGYPERYDDTRRDLYDMNSVWHPSNDLAPLISEGYQFIHHLGHANSWYVMKFQNGVLNNDLITNDGVEHGFNIAWSQGCYAGAFDNRGTNPEQYGGDCIAEKFVSELDNGFVAFIANSRYGWGSGGNTNGASQHFHREFVDAIFNEDITNIGATNQDSKEDTAPWTQAGVILWCYYEINLFGDPAMDMWTNEPEELEANFDNAVVIGDETYEVSLDGIEDATVCLSRDGEIISATLTDEDGLAVLDIPEPILPPGPVTLTIIAHNFLPFTDEIESIPSNQGFPWVEELIIEDLGGIENGQIDHGETIEISPSVHNLGRMELIGLVVTLELDDPMVRIIRGETDFDMIDADDELTPDEPLIIEIDTTCGDLHQIEFQLTFVDENEDSWSQPLSFVSHAPVLDEWYLTVLDENGDNDGRLDPGEEAEIILSIVNNGTGSAVDVTAEFVAGNPLIEVLESEANIELLEPNEMVDFERRFRVSVDEDCPDPYRAIFHVRLNGERGFRTTYLLDMDIGGALYRFDRDQDEWEHGNIGDENVDQWHLSDDDNHSFGGTGCIKVGPEQQDNDYESMLNCAIYMPEFFVEGPLQLMFWHKIDAESSRDYPGRCYDGGFVEASVDGGEWQTITPLTPDNNGYPYTIRHGQAENPLPENQPCYSGNYDWAPALFDLSEYEDSDVEIRFRFGSDGSDQRGGWWIDDIQLFMPVDDLEPPDNLDGEITETGAFLTWDEPVLLRDDDYVNRLRGYRLYRCADNWDMLPELITDNQYFDRLIGLPDMEVVYMLTAEYSDGESQPSNFLYLDWEAPDNVATEDAIPDRWEITAAFPNPFNSTVRIGYSVPIRGDVEIAVYDLNGRFVSELERGMHNPGRYEVTFEAESLPSGLYMLRMRTPVGDKTSRLVLIR